MHQGVGSKLRGRVPVFINDVHTIAHNKIMIIDGHTVVTGSFNFTKAAEDRNGENLLLLEDPDLAAKYSSNWMIHMKHSMPYSEPSKK
jgi:phosphatidylserine/phosphatidylglycerophosphate/cardiolipin synthase-like enzyme